MFHNVLWSSHLILKTSFNIQCVFMGVGGYIIVLNSIKLHVSFVPPTLSQGQKLGFPSLETVLVTHSFPGVCHNLKPSSLLLLRTKSFPVRPQNRKTLRIELVNLVPVMETPCTELEYPWKTIWFYCKLHANPTI